MKSSRSAHPLTPVVWVGFVALLLVGIGAAIGRASNVRAFGESMEPLRVSLFDAAGVNDPLAETRRTEVQHLDASFAAQPAVTRLHVIGGAIFFLLAPFQFSRRIRTRYVAFHRWSGRVLLLIGIASTIAGLYFGVVVPFGGPVEAILVGIFGAFFLISATLAWRAIRRRDIDRHREWILRMLAVALAISTVRLIGVPFGMLLSPLAFTSAEIFVITIAVGWPLTMGVAEWWIRATRRSRREIPA